MFCPAPSGLPTRQLRILGVVILGLALHACGMSEPVPPSTAATVAEVIDGDTIVIDFGGQRETVRLLGIDTPETVDPNRPVQCFGQEASDRLRSLLPAGTPVRVERDVEARDRFGRLLVYVFRASDNVFVNAVLVHEGFADVAIYGPNEAYRGELESAHTTARTQESGLWGVCGGADVALDPPPVTAPVE